MKKLLFLPLILIIAACGGDDYNDVYSTYAQWRNENNQWIAEMAAERDTDGSLYYTKVVTPWNDNAYVLMHYFNDCDSTKENLSPLFTSTVAVKYIGYLYNDTIFDSSYSNPDSLYYTTSADVIPGWAIALNAMHVGDSCDVIIPYEQAYYANGAGVILPFSCLRFSMKLVDIPYYEIKP